MIVPLSRIADALEAVSDTISAHLNIRTGEVVILTEFDDVEVGIDVPDVESDDFLTLPDYFEIDSYRILGSFCSQVPDPRAREKLLGAIQGRGAFGRFRVLADVFGLTTAWYEYRHRELERIAADWCTANGIEFSTGPER